MSPRRAVLADAWRLACSILLAGFAFLVLTTPVSGQALESESRFIVELEGGPAWQSKNDVQVPNDPSGTRIALDDLTGSGPFPAFRLYAEYRPGRRHGLRLLVAPLSLEGTGILPEPSNFNGESFAAGTPTTARYRFDSYRLTYRYRLVSNFSWRVDIGLTAKLRAAEISLEQASVSSSYSNTGFVPLLYAAAAWQPAPGWSLTLDADGAAASQGRAFDVALKLYRDLSDRWSLSAGYRTLEGGADVEDVYTFAWFHYFAVSAVYRF
jgi:hypothetical protein